MQNQILKQTNVEALKKLSIELKEIQEKERQKAIEIAKKKGWPIRGKNAKGQTYELQGIDEKGNPIYYITYNLGAAKTVSTNKVWPGGVMGLNLTGQGMKAGVWDDGGVRVTHQEFGGRVTQVDNPPSIESHSTHVTGTIAAAGINPQAKGMAFKCKVDAYDWRSDISEMAQAASQGLLISNHSYGSEVGWKLMENFTDANGNPQTNKWVWMGNTSVSTTEDSRAGIYDAKANTIDYIARIAPYYLMHWAAGNDRGEAPPAGTPYFIRNDTGGYIPSNLTTPPPADGPFNLVSSTSAAKNVLTVGAVHEIPNGYNPLGSPSQVVMSNFSCWGPTDDGRIKPDIVAKGVNVLSTSDTADNKYFSSDGTSMATPSVAGSLLLLQQHNFNKHGAYLRAATLKALVIHTADEAGPAPGPDYMFGWGLLNVAKAVQAINDKDVKVLFFEDSLLNQQTWTFKVNSDGTRPLVATLVWQDVPGPVQSVQDLNVTTKRLVNDLDLRITKGATTHYPWKLNPNFNWKGQVGPTATKGDNDLDNVEQVFIDNPEAGCYTISITHKGTLQGGAQHFSLIISEIVPDCKLAINADIQNGCIGQPNSGSIFITVAGGTPPYTYQWNTVPPNTTPSLIGIQSGNYSVKVSDGSSCCERTANIFVPSLPSVESNRGVVWTFGRNAGINFLQGTPRIFYSRILTPAGCASISNENGALQFYTDGGVVYHAQHDTMPNGVDLHGGVHKGTQTSIIVPKPGSNNIYYIFTVDSFYNPRGLKYSIVDMSLNGGLGDVTAKNIPLHSPVQEKISAVKHANGCDYWVVVRDASGNKFRSYLVSSAGVSTNPVISSVDHNFPPLPYNNTLTQGQMKFSPDGKRLAIANFGAGRIVVYDFNTATGQVLNTYIDIDLNSIPEGPYGVEFSPDGKILYATAIYFTTRRVLQFNLQAGSSAAVTASRTVLAQATERTFRSMQLAADGKIYIARFRPNENYLAVINNPNVLGTGCNFVLDGPNLNEAYALAGLPNFVQSFFKPIEAEITNTQPIRFCQGDSVLLTAKPNCDLSYQWLKDNIPIPGATRDSYWAKQQGVYRVIVRNRNRCSAISQEYWVEEIPKLAPPIANTPNCLAAGSVATVSFSLTSGSEVRIYSTSSATSAIATDNAVPYEFVILPLTTTTTYFVEAFDASTGCRSNRVPFVVGVGTQPGAPTAPATNICPFGLVSFTATMGSPAGQSIELYTQPVGGAPIASAHQAPYTLVVVPVPPITTNTTLYIAARGANSCLSNRTPVPITVSGSGQLPILTSNSPICEGQTLLLTAGGVSGATYSILGPNGFNQNSANASRANITLADTGWYTAVAIASGCTTTRSTKVQIIPRPQTPNIISNAPVCLGSTLHLSTFPRTGAAYLWRGPYGFSSTDIAPSLSITTGLQAGAYSLQVIENGCTSAVATTNVQVGDPLPRISIQSTDPCEGGTLTLTASNIPGATYTWRGPQNFVATGATISRPGMQPAWAGVYTVVAVANGCTTVGYDTVNIQNPVPPMIITNGSADCMGSNLAFTATGAPTGATYIWSGPNNYSFTGPTIQRSSLPSTGWYHAVYVINGCTSEAASVDVTHAPVPPPPPPGPNNVPPIVTCVNGYVRITVTVPPSAAKEFRLYTQSTGGTPIQVRPVDSNWQANFTFPYVSTSTTFYLATANGAGCESSPRKQIVINVTNNPPMPTIATNSPLCVGQTLHMTVSNSSGITGYNWYDPEFEIMTGGTPTSISKPNMQLSDAGTYIYFFAQGPQCQRIIEIPVQVFENNGNPPTIVANAPVCAGQTLNLSVSDPGAAKYEWSGPGGFSATGATVNRINATSAMSGTYQVVMISGACTSAPAKIDVSVIQLPDPVITTNSPVCEGQSIRLSATGPAGAIYQWRGPNNTIYTGSSVVIPNASTAHAGTYSLLVIVGACSSAQQVTTVTVSPAPTVPVTNPTSITVPMASSVTITVANVNNANTVYLYTSSTGGLPIATDNTPPYTLTTPVTNGSATYWVEAAHNILGCRSPRVPVIVNATEQTSVGAPSANNVMRCGEGVVTFTASMGNPAGNCIRLYTQISGGSPIATDCDSPYLLATSVLTTTTTFYIESSSGNAVSSRTEVIAFIDKVGAPLVESVSICGVGPVTFTVEMGVPAGQRVMLYTTPTGGTPIATSDNPPYELTTPSITTCVTYYVQVENINNCASPRTQTVACTGSLANPSAQDISICSSSIVTFTATLGAGSPLGTRIYLYTSPSGGSPIATAAVAPYLLTTTSVVTTTTTFYIQSEAPNNCRSQRVPVSVTLGSQGPPLSATSNSPVCSTDTLKLNATGVTNATYTWSGPGNFSATGASVIRFPLTNAAQGVYTVTAITGGGCTSTGTVNVSIISAPGIPNVNGIPPCVASGSTVTLTFTMGTPPGNSIRLYSSATSSTPIATLSSPPYQYTVPNITTTVNLFARVGDGTCQSLPFPIILPVGTPPGNPSASNVSGCSNGVFRFNPSMGTPPGHVFVLYSQPSGGTPVSAAPADSPLGLPVINVTTTTTFYLAAVDTNTGCQSNRVQVVAIVTSTGVRPNILGDTVRCQGQTLSLTATGVSGPFVQYAWLDPTVLPPNPTIGATLNKPNLQPEHSGIYVAFAINLFNQCTTFATRIVTVIPTPPAPNVSNNSPICPGSQLQLSASLSPPIPGASFYWTGPSGFTATDANPVRNNVTTAHAGNYLAYTIVQGCTSAASASPVSVANPPAAPVVNGNLEYCAGDNLVLNASPVTGVVFHWNGPNSFSATGNQLTRENLSAGDAGVYSVVAVIGSCTSPQTTVNVVVKPKPPIPTATSNSPRCVGDVLNLTANGVAGASFVWNGPQGFTQQGSSPTISLSSTNQAGIYSLAAVINGCTSDIATTTVVVNSPATVPTVISNTPVCQGKNLLLTVQNISSGEFLWSGPNNFAQTTTTSTVTRINLQAADAGVYSVSVVTAGCTSQVGTVTVTITPLPPTPVASNPGPFCVFQNIILNAQSTVTDPNATFMWLGPNFIANGPINVTQYTRENVTLSDEGIYSLAVISQGCTSAFATTLVRVYAIPEPPLIEQPLMSPICVGKTLTVTATYLTDTYYLWSGPNGFSATTSTPDNKLVIPNVTTANAGTYSVLVVINGCTAHAPAVFNIQVIDLLPAPNVTSNSPRCINQTLTLTAPAAAGTIYYWSGPNGFTATGAGPTFVRPNLTTADAGVYSVYAIVNGCSTRETTIEVMVNDVIPPAPAVTANTPLCVGQEVQIRVIGTGIFNVMGPASYNESGVGPIFTRTNAIVAHSGVYSVTTTVEGCTSPVATVQVTVNLPPTANASSNSPRCVGQVLNLLGANSVPNASFSWSGPNGFSSTLQNPTIPEVTTAMAGIYTLSVSVPGCPVATATANVTIIDVPAPTVTTNSPVCTGASLILSAANTLSNVTYVWNGPLGFSAITTATEVTRNNVTSSVAGVYSVVAVLSGCTSALVITEPVIVHFVPQPLGQFVNTSSTAPTSVCEGGSFRLQVINTSAFQPGTTFIWQGPQGNLPANTESYEVSAATLSHAGVYRIWAVANGCTSTASLPITVTVIPKPSTPVVTNNGPICEGQGEATIRVTPAPGIVRYQWSGPGGFSATGLQHSIPAELNNAGTYSVVAFTAEGCSSAVGTTNLVITPRPSLPVLSSNTPVCQGQTLQLSVTGPAGATYTIRGPNGYAVTGTQAQYSRADMVERFAGLYSVVAVVAGCVTPEVTHKVSVLPLPPRPVASNNGPRCEGERLSLSASGAGANVTFVWSGPAGFSATGASINIPNITPAQAGTYTLVTVENGCTSAPALTIVEITPYPIVSLSSNSPVCQGSTLTITAAGVPSGAYLQMRGPNDYFAAGNYTVFNRPNIQLGDSGTYILTVQVGACRGITASTNVRVKPVPTLDILQTNSPICEGQELRLTVRGGTVSSYVWRLPNNNSAVTTSIPEYVVPVASLAQRGVYHVSGVIDGCTTNAVSAVVSITPAPTPPVAANNGPICMGETAMFQVQPVRGASYLWLGPDGFSSTEQTVHRTISDPSMGGLYTVVAIANGCTSQPTISPLEVIHLNLAPEVSAPQTLCVGSNLQLTTSGVPSGIGYRWEGPAAFSSEQQNPLLTNVQTFNSGIYYLLAFQNGCTSRVAEVEVRVTPQPQAPDVGYNGTLCEGSTIRLTASTVVGAQYYWQGPNGFEAYEQNPTLHSLSFAQSGTYSVVAYVGNCTSEVSTVNILVEPLPAPPLANNGGPYCAGQTINLSASSVSGATYLWSGPNGYTSTQQNPTRANSRTIDSGIYSVVSIARGCTSLVATTLVQVRPSQAPASATVNSPICEGETVYLSTPLVVGASYLWSGPAGFTSTHREPIIPNATAARSGVYSVRLIMNSCTSSAISVNVSVQPRPSNISILTNSPICAGQTLLLSAPSIPGAVYHWSGPGGFSASQNNVVINNASIGASGVYRLRVSLGNCVAPIDSTTVVVYPPAPPAPRIASNSPVCEGQTLQLSASSSLATATYSWVGPNGFSSTLQNPSIPNIPLAASGVYTLTVSNGNCAAAPVTVSISVLPTPNVSIISNSPICEGSNLELSATPILGARYNWSGPNSFTSTQIGNTLPRATTRMSGIYSLEVINGSCTSRVTQNIQVNPIPTAGPILSNAPVCAGGVLSLSVPFVPGASYLWSGPNGFIATLQNPTISPVSSSNAGIYSLVTILNGCTSAVATHEVRVAGITTLPEITSNSPVCQNGLLQLSATLLPGVTYEWRGPGNFTATIANPIRSGMRLSDAGVYTLNLTTSSCRNPITLTIEVQVKPIPPVPSASNNSPICSNSSLNLTASGGGLGASYYWTGPQGYTSTLQNPTISNPNPQQSGIYNVQAIVEGCTSAAAATRVVINQAPQTPRVSVSQATVCEGERLMLTANSADGSTIFWTGPNGFSESASTLVISPVSLMHNGTYSAVAILGGCTSNVVTQNIRVIPFAPNIEAGSNSPICQGGAIELTATNVPGASYTWRGPLGYTSNLQNSTIAPALPRYSGIYTLEVRSGSCIRIVEVPVRVQAAEGEVSATASSPICEGQPLRLAANQIPGATYLWRGPQGFEATEAVVVRDGSSIANSGIYTLTVTMNGCLVNETSVEVIVLPGIGNLAASNNGPICAGSTLSLSASGNPGVLYQWSGPNGFTSTLANPTIANVNVTHGGIYSLTASLPGCSQRITVTTEVNIDAPISARRIWNNGPICSGSELALGAEAIPGATYEWRGPNGFSSTLERPTILEATPIHAGEYSLTIRRGACTLSGLTTVATVHPSPFPPSIQGNTTICEGGNLNLSAIGAASTYVWSGPNNFAATSSSIAIRKVSTLAAGVYSVVAVQNGCSSQPATVAVQVTRVDGRFLENRVSVCGGEPALLLISATGTAPWAVAYTDGVQTNTLYFNQSPFELAVSPTQITTYSLLWIEDATGCRATLNSSVIVTPSPKPEARFIQSSGTACSGSVVNIPVELRGVGPWQINYSINGIAQPLVTAGSSSTTSPFMYNLSFVASQNATVSLIDLIDATGCRSVYNQNYILEVRPCSDPCPAPTNLTVRNVTPVSANVSWQPVTSGVVCYIVSYGVASQPSTWQTRLVPHPGSSIELTGLTPGLNYTVEVRSNCNLCSSRSGTISNVPATANFATNAAKVIGIEEAYALELYPNPTSGLIAITLRSAIKGGNLAVEIVDATGRTLSTMLYEYVQGNNTWTLDLTAQPSGVYLLKIRELEEGNTRTIKVIKQ
ncbi:MAG: S8 family serine peptidase [Bacteroidia bacterium]|nr:S8 family serine peptidase [Bacteroidia bacterium]